MPFRIAIVDDEAPSAELLGEMIEKFERETGRYSFAVTVFSDAAEFLDRYRRGAFDVIFLDIRMPEISGMDVARRVRDERDDAILVFVTNMAQYALESYEVHAYDFVVKPIQYDSFSLKFARICNALGHKFADAEVTLVSGQTKRRVAVADITYIEIYDHNLTVHTVHGEIKMRGTMKEMEKQFSRFHFVLCNVCYLVNLKYVEEIGGDIVTVAGDRLRISHLKKQAFLSEFARYIGGSV